MNYEEVMKLALERGFYFPSCEVYSDANAGFWEYGPSGVSLKNKFLELWRRELIRRDGMMEIDGSQIMSKSVFEASGHLGNFADPIIKCTKCNSTFRADRTIAEIANIEIPESADYDWALKKAMEYLELDKGLIGIDHQVIKQIIDKMNLNAKTVDGDHALRKIKIIKSKREIELMRISAQTNADATISAIKQLRNGATHQDLKALFFSECSKRGNVPSLLQIDTVNSEVYNKELKDGDSFAIDAVSHGFHYNGDFGRTVFMGEPTKSMKKATEAISLGWDAVREKLRPGLRYSEIRRIGRDAMKKAGYKYSVALTPHSIGLSHTDEPGKNGAGSFWQKDDLVLEENMIISVDLPVLNTGIGGSAHLEDLTLITSDGGEQINDIGNRIIVL